MSQVPDGAVLVDDGLQLVYATKRAADILEQLRFPSRRTRRLGALRVPQEALLLLRGDVEPGVRRRTCLCHCPGRRAEAVAEQYFVDGRHWRALFVRDASRDYGVDWRALCAARSLSRAEEALARHIVEGLGLETAARMEHCSLAAVRTRARSLYRKLDAHCLAEARSRLLWR